MKNESEDSLSGRRPWDDYQMLVMGTLRDLKAEVESTNAKIDLLRKEFTGELSALQNGEISKLKIQVATIRATALAYGAAAGFILGLIPMIISIITLLKK